MMDLISWSFFGKQHGQLKTQSRQSLDFELLRARHRFSESDAQQSLPGQTHGPLGPRSEKSRTNGVNEIVWCEIIVGGHSSAWSYVIRLDSGESWRINETSRVAKCVLHGNRFDWWLQPLWLVDGHFSGCSQVAMISTPAQQNRKQTWSAHGLIWVQWNSWTSNWIMQNPSYIMWTVAVTFKGWRLCWRFRAVVGQLVDLCQHRQFSDPTISGSWALMLSSLQLPQSWLPPHFLCQTWQVSSKIIKASLWSPSENILPGQSHRKGNAQSANISYRSTILNFDEKVTLLLSSHTKTASSMVAQQSSAYPPVRVTVWPKLKFSSWFLVPIFLACHVSSESLPKPRVPVYWSERGQFPETTPLALIFHCPTTLAKIHPAPSAHFVSRMSLPSYQKYADFLRFQCLSLPVTQKCKLQPTTAKRRWAELHLCRLSPAQLFEPNSWRLWYWSTVALASAGSSPFQRRNTQGEHDTCWHVLTSRLESRYFGQAGQMSALQVLRHDRNPPEIWFGHFSTQANCWLPPRKPNAWHVCFQNEPNSSYRIHLADGSHCADEGSMEVYGIRGIIGKPTENNRCQSSFRNIKDIHEHVLDVLDCFAITGGECPSVSFVCGPRMSLNDTGILLWWARRDHTFPFKSRISKFEDWSKQNSFGGSGRMIRCKSSPLRWNESPWAQLSSCNPKAGCGKACQASFGCRSCKVLMECAPVLSKNSDRCREAYQE